MCRRAENSDLSDMDEDDDWDPDPGMGFVGNVSFPAAPAAQAPAPVPAPAQPFIPFPYDGINIPETPTPEATNGPFLEYGLPPRLIELLAIGIDERPVLTTLRNLVPGEEAHWRGGPLTRATRNLRNRIEADRWVHARALAEAAAVTPDAMRLNGPSELQVRLARIRLRYGAGAETFHGAVNDFFGGGAAANGAAPAAPPR